MLRTVIVFKLNPFKTEKLKQTLQHYPRINVKSIFGVLNISFGIKYLSFMKKVRGNQTYRSPIIRFCQYACL